MNNTKLSAQIGCLIPIIILGAIGFNALFCHAGYADESEGSLMRLSIGAIIGLFFGLCVVLDD